MYCIYYNDTIDDHTHDTNDSNIDMNINDKQILRISAGQEGGGAGRDRVLRPRDGEADEAQGRWYNILVIFYPSSQFCWNRCFPPEPANTAKHSPKSISEGGRIWQV